jgi:hypothetical protein
MTDESRPVRQISGNLQKFQAAISELTHFAVRTSARFAGELKLENTWETPHGSYFDCLRIKAVQASHK